LKPVIDPQETSSGWHDAAARAGMLVGSMILSHPGGDKPMHVFGTFELDIQSGTPDEPVGIKIALLRYTVEVQDEHSRLVLAVEMSRTVRRMDFAHV
jgi:hypothetical protein